MIIRVVKEKNILSLYVEGQERPVEIDCKPAQVIVKSYTGRTVKHLPKAVQGGSGNVSYLYQMLKTAVEKGDKTALQTIEPFLPYFDKLVYPFPRECPKGYIKYVLENELSFNMESLQAFKRKDIFTPEFVKLREELGKRFNYWDIFEFFNYNTTYLHMIVKYLYKITTNTFYYNFSLIYTNFVNAVRKYSRANALDEFMKVFDKDHRLEVNTKALETYLESIQDSILIKQEDVIREITKLSNETYTIIVPEKPDDFTNEGAQQRNCVGYNYHDYVRRGDGVIYFIRLTESPDKSYITCRHDYTAKCTTEHKMKNNTPNKDAAARAFIREIDKMITEIMEKR